MKISRQGENTFYISTSRDSLTLNSFSTGNELVISILNNNVQTFPFNYYTKTFSLEELIAHEEFQRTKTLQEFLQKFISLLLLKRSKIEVHKEKINITLRSEEEEPKIELVIPVKILSAEESNEVITNLVSELNQKSWFFENRIKTMSDKIEKLKEINENNLKVNEKILKKKFLLEKEARNLIKEKNDLRFYVQELKASVHSFINLIERFFKTSKIDFRVANESIFQEMLIIKNQLSKNFDDDNAMRVDRTSKEKLALEDETCQEFFFSPQKEKKEKKQSFYDQLSTASGPQSKSNTESFLSTTNQSTSKFFENKTIKAYLSSNMEGEPSNFQLPLPPAGFLQKPSDSVSASSSSQKSSSNLSSTYPLSIKKVTQDFVIKEHFGEVTSLCFLRNGKLASSSTDGTIKIINLQSRECEITLQGHKESITYVSDLPKGNLISCSNDKTIKIWSLSSHLCICLSTLKDHSGQVNKVIPLSQNRIASCSTDRTIRIWSDDPPFRCLKTIRSLSNIVSIIEMQRKSFLVSASSLNDNHLIFWNSKTYECVKVINHIYCSSQNSLYELPTEKLIVGGYNTITVVNTDNFQTEARINDETLNFVNCFLQIQNMLLCGCCFGKICEIGEDYQITYKKSAHSGDLTDLVKLKRNEFASSSRDMTIKIWVSFLLIF